MIENNNKRIVLNTVIVYMRMIVTSVLSLITTRLVLNILGQSDFGLFYVVGGVVGLLNFISTAMSTTTRRFINIEMGKQDGNLNKIFNISLRLHIGFAIFIFFIAETIGIIYINNFLNVDPTKLYDAHFIFQISTCIAAIGIINVPYQALLAAYEKFSTLALIDILYSIMKVGLIVSLLYYKGNALRAFAIINCICALGTMIVYQLYCYRKWHPIIKWNTYKDKQKYKEILVFNNYTALGAVSYIAHSQGTDVILNFFFGTLVNGAYAIAKQIETFMILLVSNLGTAAGPQLTQNYGKGDVDRSILLTSKINKYSILFMLLLVSVLFIELEFILKLWLGDIPEDALLFCQLTLISAFVRSLSEGIPVLISATGKIKWFQIIGTSFTFATLILSIIAFKLGFPAFSIIILFIIKELIYRLISFVLLYRLINFDVYSFIKKSYLPALKVILITLIYFWIYGFIKIETTFSHIAGLMLTSIFIAINIYIFGLESSEKSKINQIIKSKIYH